MESLAKAVREEVITARQILRANLSEASIGLQEAGSKLQQNLDVAGSKLGSVLEQNLGVPLPIPTLASSNGPSSVCDACALPFQHGGAIQPEIRKLQNALDACPEEAELRGARERLWQLDHELQLVNSAPINPLQVLSDGSMQTATASAVAAVATMLTRETNHDKERVAEEHEATERAAVAREEFVRRIEADRQEGKGAAAET